MVNFGTVSPIKMQKQGSVERKSTKKKAPPVDPIEELTWYLTKVFFFS
jgi:hypothetical protein